MMFDRPFLTPVCIWAELCSKYHLLSCPSCDPKYVKRTRFVATLPILIKIFMLQVHVHCLAVGSDYIHIAPAPSSRAIRLLRAPKNIVGHRGCAWSVPYLIEWGTEWGSGSLPFVPVLSGSTWTLEILPSLITRA